MPEAVVRLADVRYSYPRGGFSLVCEAAEFHAGAVTVIAGPNGSGKTTLAKLMCGILRPADGRVFIGGEDAGAHSLGHIGRTLGYLCQEPARQLFAATVWEELCFLDGLLDRDRAETERKAAGLLEDFDLSPLRERSVYHLSRGEKQRLALASVMMGGARFFILDEPTTGLDRENRLRLYSLMDSLCAQGAGFAVVSHDRELLRRYGTRRVAVQEGVVQA